MDRPVRWRMDSGYEVISWAESYHELDGVYPYDLEDLAQDCILSKLDGKARNLSGIRTMRSIRERLDERMRRARVKESAKKSSSTDYAGYAIPTSLRPRSMGNVVRSAWSTGCCAR